MGRRLKLTALGIGLAIASVALAQNVLLRYFGPATGILVGTAGNPETTAATSSNVIGLFTGCSGTLLLGADGACHSASGGGITDLTSTGSTITVSSPTGPTANIDLPTTAVSAGSYTYTGLTVDAYGRITAASNGTPVTSFSAGSTGLTPSSATTGAIVLGGTLALASGGTNATTKAAAFNNLSPMTTTGDLEYDSSGGTAARLAIGSTGQFLGVSGGIPAWTTTLGYANGGTNATTAAAAFNNLAPMTTTGDIVYDSAAATAARLAIGSTGQVLTVAAGVPSWANPSSGLLAFSGGQPAVSITVTTTPTTGGVTLGSQTAAVGSIWRVHADGGYVAASSSTARTAKVTVFWGSTTLAGTAATVLVSSAGTTYWHLDFLVLGVSTTSCALSGYLAGGFTTDTATLQQYEINPPTTTTVSSGAQTIDVRYSMSSATPADEWVIYTTTIERLQ